MRRRKQTARAARIYTYVTAGAFHQVIDVNALIARERIKLRGHARYNCRPCFFSANTRGARCRNCVFVSTVVRRWEKNLPMLIFEYARASMAI